MLYSGGKNLVFRLNNFGLRWALKRSTSTALPSVSVPQKIEMFIDDKKILVDPNITILQVIFI